MIVLLFSVMAGLATLARGLLFTVAVCLALVASVAVLHASLRIGGMAGGPAWIAGVLAILAFVLVVGGPAYLLAIRTELSRLDVAPDGDRTEGSPDEHRPHENAPTGDVPTDDDSAVDPDTGVDEETSRQGSLDDPDELPDVGAENRDGAPDDERG